MTPAILSSSTLMGDPIVGRDGDKLGTLKEIMIDLVDGSVAYAVLARGGLGSMGQKLFAVPWTMLTVDGDNHQLVLDAHEQLLDDSPGFDPENWPTFSDTTWRESVDRHLGLVP